YGDSEIATKAHRVIADHARAMTFLIADGVVPSNEGRGYVLRRVIRRAVQHGQRIGLHELWPVTAIVVEQMHPWYPELREHEREIQEVVRNEEERFSETLERGLRLVEEIAGGADGGADRDPRARGARGRALPGEARALALLPGRRRPGHRCRLHRRRGDGRARRARRGDAARGRRPGADVPGRGLPRRAAGPGGR